MNKIYIVNKKIYSGPGEYIGRPSPLGNPFVIDKDGTREEVIELYKKHLIYSLTMSCDMLRWQDKRISQELCRLYDIYKQRDLILICWCAPKLCHGNIIRDILLKKIEY